MLRRILRWTMLGLFLLALVPVFALAYNIYRAGHVDKNSILHVVFDGPIDELAQPNVGQLFGSPLAPTLHQLTQGIRHAGRDARITGLLLEVRTPQVGVAQLEEIAEAIDAFKESGKWNVSFLETAGELGHGDGAYALASLADKVILSPPGEIHLSGLHTETQFYKGAIDKVGVGVYAEQRYEYKNFANTYTQEKYTAPHKEALAHVLDDLQRTMLQLIARHRKTDEQAVRSWILAAPHSAEAAKALHLVDEVAYWDHLEEMARHHSGRDEPFIDADVYCHLQHEKKGGRPVALIIAAGEIDRGDSSGLNKSRSAHVGSDTFAQAFRDAREDKVEAVLLRIDSPGGSYIASDVIRREIELTRDANIPIVVSMGNTAASGGYMLALEADHIIAEAGTITGSIGVVAAAFSIRQAVRKWTGVTFDTYDVLPHPGTLSWLDPPSEADRARFGAAIDRIYKEFVTRVAKGRRKTYDEIHAIAKGRIWTGRQAVDNGLADELGGFSAATQYIRQRLKMAPGERLELMMYPEAPSVLSALKDVAGAHIAVRHFVGQVIDEATALGFGPAADGLRAQLRLPSPL